MGQDMFALQPTLNYSLTKDISVTHFISIDTNAHLKWQLGLAYQLSKSAQLSVNYEEECENFTELKKSMIIMMINYQGYQMKLPIIACNQRQNGPGMALNLLCTGVANYAAYRSLKWHKSRKPEWQKAENRIAHGLYMHNLERLNQFVHQMNNIIESSIAIERRNSGLLILDAYFGLDEHIY